MTKRNKTALRTKTNGIFMPKMWKVGHWQRKHNKNESLPDHVKSVDTSSVSKINSDSRKPLQNANNKKKTVIFIMAHVINNNRTSNFRDKDVFIGHLIDDCATCSAISEMGLQVMKNEFVIE